MGKDKLRAAVEAHIREMQKLPPSPDEAIRQEVLARVERLRQKVAQAPKRILEEDDDDLRAALRAGFRDLQAELAAAEMALADAEKRMPHREPPTSVEAEVEKAMTLMDRIETHVAGRRATLTGRSSITSPTIRDRTVIQGKSGRPATCVP